MNPSQGDHTLLLRRLAWTGAILAMGLIVLGGVVRITGSGMGCGDHWPRCHGQWFPPLDLPTMIEIGHRWVAALVSVLVLATATVAWWRHRAEPSLRNPATLALVLLVVQVLLGAVTVKLALPAWVVIAHLANAMILLAVLLVTALRAAMVEQKGAFYAPLPRHSRHSGHGMVLVTAGLGFIVILLGANVANLHAGLLCLGFPLCNGALLPSGVLLASLPWAHRFLAFLFLALVSILTVRLRSRPDPAGRTLTRYAASVL
ncbi:MAG: COX15/CtaA family protein, partial [Gemmatimonadales bacterium]